VGGDAINSHTVMAELAGKVFAECDGLPLALIAIPGAMSGKMLLDCFVHQSFQRPSFVSKS